MTVVSFTRFHLSSFFVEFVVVIVVCCFHFDFFVFVNIIVICGFILSVWWSCGPGWTLDTPELMDVVVFNRTGDERVHFLLSPNGLTEREGVVVVESLVIMTAASPHVCRRWSRLVFSVACLSSSSCSNQLESVESMVHRRAPFSLESRFHCG